MAGREHKAEQFVAKIVVHRRLDRFGGMAAVALGLVGDLDMLARLHLLAADAVDGASFGDGHQPGARIGGNAGFWPFGECDQQRILCQFLGKVSNP